MSNFNCDNPSDYITLNEPPAVFWDGNSCKDSKKQVAKTGAYYCGYKNCNNNLQGQFLKYGVSLIILKEMTGQWL